MSMAVSELSAVGAPSQTLANQLMALFSPCGLVSIMAVLVASASCRSKQFRIGIGLFAAMEWLCSVGYAMFPWVSDADISAFQNVMHLAVTVGVVLLSILSLLLIAYGARKEGNHSLSIWACVCLGAMFLGAIGTNAFPTSVFGIFERCSTFSAVIFNAVLGWYLFAGRLTEKGNE
jgi:apolipoprotein N-acyltransferase